MNKNNHAKSIAVRTNASRKESGIALMMALIAVVAMSLTAMALLRSVDTGNIISGNVAFRQATAHTTDVGIETGFAALNAMASSSLGSNVPSSCTNNCTYYATTQSTDASTNLPTGIDWSAIPVATTLAGAYTVKYSIDRLCSVANVTDPPQQCYLTKRDPKEIAHDSRGGGGPDQNRGTYFRVTVQVSGPRNTISYSQATFIRY